jgi:hypothetical protein
MVARGRVVARTPSAGRPSGGIDCTIKVHPVAHINGAAGVVLPSCRPGRQHMAPHSSQGVSAVRHPGWAGVARKLQMDPGGICGTSRRATAGAPNDEIEVESRDDRKSSLNPVRGMS